MLGSQRLSVDGGKGMGEECSSAPVVGKESIGLHTMMTFHVWFGSYLSGARDKVLTLDGTNLTISRLLSVARGAKVCLSEDPQVRERMSASVNFLKSRLDEGWTIYGVNTGVGGSADARTSQLEELQISLLQHTHCGIISNWERKTVPNYSPGANTNVLPTSWVRASILTRANQLLSGHSAIRLEVVKSLIDILNHGILPLIPKRGSLSASGDLMPLSYIAGTITGNPAIACSINFSPEPEQSDQPVCKMAPVQGGPDVATSYRKSIFHIESDQASTQESVNGRQRDRGSDQALALRAGVIVPADRALAASDIEPIKLMGKEGLALVNGTAPSAAAAAMNISSANQLALLAQVLTALTSECLAGNVEWLAPFIHDVRPHPGQKECASNIREFLAGSKLVAGLTLDYRPRTKSGLCQDRYSTRTSPQWLGPYLEDLTTASQQVRTELNSTSDNPLIDVEGSDIFHGGNFQATSMTSAMDKTRQALVAIGRLVYSQCQELIDPTKNNGLPTNLVADCPSKSFTMKGIDTVIAGYVSELSSLAGPVIGHIFPAEMGNQGVNSMALLSARKTSDAVDIVTHMMAYHIYVLCQAADLRAFQEDVKLKASLDVDEISEWLGIDRSVATDIKVAMDPLISSSWEGANTMAFGGRRVERLVDQVGGRLLGLLRHHNMDGLDFQGVQDAAAKMARRYRDIDSLCADAWLDVEQVTKKLPTTAYLAKGTSHLYRFVRQELGIPLHRGVVHDPLSRDDPKTSDMKKTIGGWVSDIVQSLTDGSLLDHIMFHLVYPAVLRDRAVPSFEPRFPLAFVPEEAIQDENEHVCALADKSFHHRMRTWHVEKDKTPRRKNKAGNCLPHVSEEKRREWRRKYGDAGLGLDGDEYDECGSQRGFW